MDSSALAPVRDHPDEALLRSLVGISAGLTVETVLDRLVRSALSLPQLTWGATAVAGIVAPGGRLLTVTAAVRDLHGVGELEPARAATAYAELLALVGTSAVSEESIVVHGASQGVLLLRTGEPAGNSCRRGMQGLAAAAGVAIGNARLFEQAEQRRRWLEAAGEILASMLGDADRDQQLTLVAERAREVAGADLAMILLPCGPDELVVEVLSRSGGGDPSGLRGTRMAVEGTLCGQVVLCGEAVVVDDPPAHPAQVRADVQAPADGDASGPTLLVPLGTSDDVRGVLAVARRLGSTNFTTADVQLATNFGNQAALAIDRARAQSDRAQLAVLEDRDRIARDLHDLVIQRLFATGLQMQGMSRSADEKLKAKIEGAVDNLDQTIRDIRTTIFQLNRKPDSTDLRGQIHDVVDEAARPLGFAVLLDLHGPISDAVPDDLAPHLLAVVRESLSNVAKHAGASAVTVTVTADRSVTLTVEDDGRGFVADRHGSGVRNMRRRAEMHGGSLEIAARPGGGTRLQWCVPCP